MNDMNDDGPSMKARCDGPIQSMKDPCDGPIPSLKDPYCSILSMEEPCDSSIPSMKYPCDCAIQSMKHLCDGPVPKLITERCFECINTFYYLGIRLYETIIINERFCCLLLFGATRAGVYLSIV